MKATWYDWNRQLIYTISHHWHSLEWGILCLIIDYVWLKVVEVKNFNWYNTGENVYINYLFPVKNANCTKQILKITKSALHDHVSLSQSSPDLIFDPLNMVPF